MNTPFLHIFWKEYRSLRWMWLGCLVGTAAVGLVIWLPVNDIHPRHLEFLWSLALWLPVVYLLACVAATFAGEREERTDDWLRQLAVPPGPTIAAKLLWPLLSAAAMQGVLLGLVFLARHSVRRVWLQQQFLDRLPVMPGDDLLSALPGVALFALLEVLAIGVLWSVLTRHAISAVVAGILHFIAIQVLSKVFESQIPAESHLLDPWGGLRTAGLLAVLGADFWLAHRWIAGRLGNGPASLPGMRLLRPASQVIEPDPRGNPPSAVAAAVVETSIGDQEPSAPWRRAWQRLLWLELRRTRNFVLVWVALAIATPVVLWLCALPDWAIRTFEYGTLTATLLPFSAGWVAWRGDQAQQRYRFFADRGVSPEAVWLSKLVAWLAAQGVVLLAATALAWIIGHFQPPDVPQRLEEFALVTSAAGAGDRSTSMVWMLRGVLGLILFLTTFALGLSVRRSVILLFAALLANHGVIQVVSLGILMGLPDLLVYGPLLGWLLWCIARQAPRWLLETRGRHRVTSLVVECGLVPLMGLASWLLWWMFALPALEITGTEPGMSGIRTMHFLTPQMRSKHPTRGWPEVSQAIAEVFAAGPWQASIPRQPTAKWRLDDTQWQQVEAPVQRLRDRLLEAEGEADLVPPDWSLMSLLMTLADRDLAAGRRTESQRAVRAAVRVGGLGLTGLKDRGQHLVLHERLVQWAGRAAPVPYGAVGPGNDSIDPVRQTLQWIGDDDLRFWITPGTRWVKLCEAQLRALQDDHVGWTTRWTTIRQRRLYQCALWNRLTYQACFPRGIRGTGPIPWMTSFDGAHERAWNYRGPGINSIPLEHPVGLEPEAIVEMWDNETKLRCTLAAMAVAAYRQSFGQFPQTLEEVVPYYAPGDLLQDPWSRRLLALTRDDQQPDTRWINSVGPLHATSLPSWTMPEFRWTRTSHRPSTNPPSQPAPPVKYHYPAPVPDHRPEGTPALPGP